MRKIILLLSLVFFISIVNAATITYNFSSVFEGNNTFAFRDNFGIDSPPPANSILPFSDTLVDITSQSELDLSDDTTYSFNCGSTGSGPNCFVLTKVNLSIVSTDVTAINLTWEGFSDSTELIVYRYLWNASSSSWFQCDDSSASVSDTQYSCFNSKPSYSFNSQDMINSTGWIHFLTYGNVSSSTTRNLYTDYIKVEITYLGNVNTTLISPNNATETNVLSQNFVCNYTSSSSRELTNATLQIWNSTNSLVLTNTTNITGTTNSTNLSVIFSIDDTYQWNCVGYNIDNNFDLGNTNRTIIIETGLPSPNITSIETTLGSQTVKFNHTAIDLDNNLDTSSTGCRYYVTNSSGALDVVNTSISCNTNNTQFTVSAFGSYNLTLVAFDTAGNQNSTTSNFSVSDTVNGGTTTGGGGGTTTIITQIITNWTFVTDTRTNRFDFIMTAGSTRERKLIFTNLKAEITIIKVKCEDISGDICKYIKFNDVNTSEELTQQNFLFQQTLTGSTNVEQIVDFILELPEDIADGTYDFNIVGIDQNGGENKVSVRVRVGGLGILSIIIDKLLGKTTVDLSVISNNLKDLSIPNIVIIVLI